MTAAAIRPGLFTHLFATQRQQREQSDVAATAISLLLHGTMALGLVWASTSIKPDETRVVETVHPIVIAAPDVARQIERGGGGGGAAGGPSLVVPQNIDAPILDTPSTTPFDPTKDFAQPGAPPMRSTDPSGSGTGDRETRSGFEVRSVAPALLNPDEVKRSLERNYPALLRDSGIGGRVMLWLLLDESGRVIQTDVKETSGHTAFDDAARKVGQMMRFSPAVNRDQRVKVWVALPIVFTTR